MMIHGCCKRGNRHPLWKTWYEMHERCNNPKKDNYHYYGGRGITVCERWNDILMFIQDMGDRPFKHTLDRINYDGNYEPSNCRWADKFTQANNTKYNRKLVVNGEVIGLSEASRKYDIDVRTVWMRLKNGWNEERAVLTKVRKHKKYELRSQQANERALNKI